LLKIDALGVDREFPPLDTQEFSLLLQNAGSSRCTAGFTGTREWRRRLRWVS